MFELVTSAPPGRAKCARCKRPGLVGYFWDIDDHQRRVCARCDLALNELSLRFIGVHDERVIDRYRRFLRISPDRRLRVSVEVDRPARDNHQEPACEACSGPAPRGYSHTWDTCAEGRTRRLCSDCQGDLAATALHFLGRGKASPRVNLSVSDP